MINIKPIQTLGTVTIVKKEEKINLDELQSEINGLEKVKKEIRPIKLIKGLTKEIIELINEDTLKKEMKLSELENDISIKKEKLEIYKKLQNDKNNNIIRS